MGNDKELLFFFLALSLIKPFKKAEKEITNKAV